MSIHFEWIEAIRLQGTDGTRLIFEIAFIQFELHFKMISIKQTQKCYFIASASLGPLRIAYIYYIYSTQCTLTVVRCECVSLNFAFSADAVQHVRWFCYRFWWYANQLSLRLEWWNCKISYFLYNFRFLCFGSKQIPKILNSIHFIIHSITVEHSRTWSIQIQQTMKTQKIKWRKHMKNVFIAATNK